MLTSAIEAVAALMALPENNAREANTGLFARLLRVGNITSNPMVCHILRGADVIATRAFIFSCISAVTYCAMDITFSSDYNRPYESTLAAAGFGARVGAIFGALDLYRYYSERADNRGQLLMLAAEARRQRAEEGEISEALMRQMLDRMSMMTETEMRSIGV